LGRRSARAIALRPEPPAPAPVLELRTPQVAPPELADYAELCA